ncbi:MAG TPA: uracil-DNA glycosylase family protein [Candidatus Tumulicola sp.]|jgi:DNA polymerase
MPNPKTIELKACRPWLAAEIEAVRPRIVVALGATAAQTLLGAGFRLTQNRGEVLSSDLVATVMTTVHPASILRVPDKTARHQAMREFVEDLQRIVKTLGALAT